MNDFSPTTIPSFGFARGAVVTHGVAGGNMLVVRQLDRTTAVIAIESDKPGDVRLREYPTKSLRQLLPSNHAGRSGDEINPPPDAPPQRFGDGTKEGTGE